MTIHLSADTAMALALALAMSDPGATVPIKRSAAAQAIEDLINFLDETEGDCDIEESGDERDSSWPEGGWRGGAFHEDDEDTYDAEATNEDGGNVTDEPHDAADEGNEEHSLCYRFGKDGAIAEHDGPMAGFMGCEAKRAVDLEVRSMLAKVGGKSAQPLLQVITDREGRNWTMVW